MTITAELAADRARTRQIIQLPEATGQLAVAIALAIEGATVAEARIILQAAAMPVSPDEVAAHVNKENRR